MPQIHRVQHGCFHVVTNTAGRVPWCTKGGVPDSIVGDLVRTRDLYGAKLHAFCILPDHVHLIMVPGPRGLSPFMQSFKSNSMKRLQAHLPEISEDMRWKKGFYDERIRDSRQRAAAIAYVQGNAMKHGLVGDVQDWPWTSLHFPEVVDPMDIW